MAQLPVFLDDVIVTSQLTLRESRPPDFRAEIQTITILVDIMSQAPDAIWQRLAEAASQLCRSGTAGVSLLDTEGSVEVFRTAAVVGVLSGYLTQTIPRASPCGVALDRDGTQLMYLPERFFSTMKFEPAVVEALIIPFRVNNQPIGTVWVVGHDGSCKFDREDERICRTLSSFAAAGWHLHTARRNAVPATKPDRSKLHRSETLEQDETIDPTHMRQELQHLSQRLEARASEKTADLIAAERRLEASNDLQEKLQRSDAQDNATALQGETGDFDSLLTIIQGYSKILKADADDPTKLKEDIEVISEAASLVQALIKSRGVHRQRLG